MNIYGPQYIEEWEVEGGHPIYVMSGHVGYLEFASELLRFYAATMDPKEVIEYMDMFLDGDHLGFQHRRFLGTLLKGDGSDEWEFCSYADPLSERVTVYAP